MWLSGRSPTRDISVSISTLEVRWGLKEKQVLSSQAWEYLSLPFLLLSFEVSVEVSDHV